MDENKKDVLAILGACVTLPILVAIFVAGNAVISGWVLTFLWRWFITPVFGLEPIQFVPAIGICIVIGFLTHHYVDAKRPDRSEWKTLENLILVYIIAPLLTLLTAWIVHLFM